MIDAMSFPLAIRDMTMPDAREAGGTLSTMGEDEFRLFRAAARHESESHRRNSLFRIATNLVRDTARHDKYRQEVSLEEHASQGYEPKANAPTPEQQVAAQSDLRR